jgi:hypothetical protein
LDSDALREELSDHTPIHHPSIIPPACTLRFFYSFNSSQHNTLSDPINLSSRFDNVDQMRNVFNDRLYTSQLVLNIGGKKHAFWVKSLKQSGTAFVRAFGIQVSHYIMRYRPVIYVELGPIIMKISGKNIGVGFCNFTQSNKGVQGHQMIHLEVESMDTVCVQFYSTTKRVSMHDISVQVMTYQQKKKQIIPKKDAPLVLLDGKQYLHCEGDIVQYDDVYATQLTDVNYHQRINEDHCQITEPHKTHSPSDYPPFCDIDSNSKSMELFPDQMPFAGFDNDSVSTISPRYMMQYDSPLTPPPPMFNPYNASPSPDMMDELCQQKPQRMFQSMGPFNNPRNGIHRRLRRRRERSNVSDGVKYMRTKPVIQERM